MATYRFRQVDVFTPEPFRGNPVAVVLGADGLDTTEMQRIATWTNLSETTFVLSPTVAEADYRLRIFTPTSELPFAGHPTIGSAHAILESGLIKPPSSHFVQECEAGLLTLRVKGTGAEQRLFVQAPPAKISVIDHTSQDKVAAALGARPTPNAVPAVVDVGPVWLIAQMDSAEVVHGLQPNMAAIDQLSRELGLTGITVFGLSGAEHSRLYVRSFAPAANVPEDPVCGSGNASVGAFLAHSDQLRVTGESYVANQGNEVGRNGFVNVSVRMPGPIVEIGGAAVTCIEGSLRI